MTKLILLLLASALLVHVSVGSVRSQVLVRSQGFANEDGVTRLLKTADDASATGGGDSDKKSGDDDAGASTADTKKKSGGEKAAEGDDSAGGDAADETTSTTSTAATDDESANDDDANDDDSNSKVQTSTNNTVSDVADKIFNNENSALLEHHPHWVAIAFVVVALGLCLKMGMNSFRQRRNYQEIPTSMVV